MTAEQVRAALARIPERCAPRCKGWAIITSGLRGPEIQRCDDCNHGEKLGPRGRELTDEDMQQLPEAREALRAATVPPDPAWMGDERRQVRAIVERKLAAHRKAKR